VVVGIVVDVVVVVGVAICGVELDEVSAGAL
jgi:hypothetical protein